MLSECAANESRELLKAIRSSDFESPLLVYPIQHEESAIQQFLAW